MLTIVILTVVAVVVLAGVYGFARLRQEPGANPAMADTDARAVHARLAGGERLLLIDVREAHEWKQGHIPGARWIPLGQLAARAGDIPHDQELILVCRSGNRSGSACRQLRTLGFSQVRNMRGGMLRWDGPVER